MSMMRRSNYTEFTRRLNTNGELVFVPRNGYPPVGSGNGNRFFNFFLMNLALITATHGHRPQHDALRETSKRNNSRPGTQLYQTSPYGFMIRVII
jgi:hypothetical protein